jgi:glycosyltransferase involved in cell wall biosynthesis
MFSTRDPMKMQRWDGMPARVFYGEDNPDAARALVGFYAPENWGVWSRTDSPWLVLPFKARGPLIVSVELAAYGKNICRNIEFTLGKETLSIIPGEASDIYELRFTPGDEADVLMISNLDLQRAEGSTETRSIGLGILSLEMRRPVARSRRVFELISTGLEKVRKYFDNESDSESQASGNQLDLTGIVYTSVFNPQDGRKNWEQMITAFCWAFRKQENATLILKMTHSNYLTFLGRLLSNYAKMAPFKCRVIAVHGFLTDEQYQVLIQSTHFIVNTSTAEGQCLPLMEFMGQGVPAVAPDHTAMADYINRDNAFVIEASLYPTNWPQDKRKTISTMAYRINWDSLRMAFEDSYNLATQDLNGYCDMQINSVKAIERCAGTSQVEKKIRQLACTTAKSVGHNKIGQDKN